MSTERAPLFNNLMCNSCNRKLDGFSCEAFIGGIPEAILSGEFNHVESFHGDNGLQYTTDGNL